MFKRSVNTLFNVTILAAVCAGSAFGQAAQPQWKDNAEYELFQAFTKETDLKKKLALLDQWKQKYPDSAFKVQGGLQYLPAYAGLRMPEKVIEAGANVLALDPKNLQALYLMAANTQHMTRPTPEVLSMADKAANSLLANLDELFAPDKKPANVSDADWKKTKSDAEIIARTDLGWTAMQRKDFDNAEKLFKKALETNPNNSQVTYWLAEVIRLQKKPERQAEVLYLYARAAYYDGPGALTPQGRADLDKFVTKAYTAYHGEDPKALAELKAMAKSQPLPPPDFKIESKAEIEAKKSEQLTKENPQLALWINIKDQLLAANGEQYWESSMKGAAVPKLRGTLISESPATRPKELVLGIVKPDVPEVTLKFPDPLPAKAEPGTQIEFEGVPSSFTKEPFMVTFDVEGRDKISCWKGNDKISCWPQTKKTVTKKGGAAAKKKKKAQ